MPIITLLVVLALIGLAYWGITTLIPMPAQIAKVILVVCVVVAVLVVLSAFGILPTGVMVPRLR